MATHPAHSCPRSAYILRSFPRLSQTFILHEMLALEQLGVPIHVFAITNPREPIVQPLVASLRAPVAYLDAAAQRPRRAVALEHMRALLAAPARYMRALRYVLARRDLDAGYAGASRFTCFLQAVYLAALLRRERRAGRPIEHLHAHFAHAPTLIALLTHKLTGVSFSFTAHARDLYQLPPPIVAERAAQATAVLTCCGPNLRYLHEILPAEARGKVELIYHGVQLDAFQPRAPGGEPAEAPLILSVGRLVEKKGFPDLVGACQRLRAAGRRFQCQIVGEGPLEAVLRAQIAAAGLEDTVLLPGACTQQQLIPLMQRADIFALAPFVTDDGDRDGVPNVLVEAMACGVPVVSTAVAGIPDLVTHDHNGVLVAARDVGALAAGLADLLDDPDRRRRLGAAARQTVAEHFDLRSAARRIAALLQRRQAASPAMQPA